MTDPGAHERSGGPETQLRAALADLERGDIITISNAVLSRVHPEGRCGGTHCWIHGASDHPLRDAPLLATESNIIMRVCAHGGHHLDPDDAAWRGRAQTKYRGWVDDAEEFHTCCEHLCCGNYPRLRSLPAPFPEGVVLVETLHDLWLLAHLPADGFSGALCIGATESPGNHKAWRVFSSAHALSDAAVSDPSPLTVGRRARIYEPSRDEWVDTSRVISIERRPDITTKQLALALAGRLYDKDASPGEEED